MPEERSKNKTYQKQQQTNKQTKKPIMATNNLEHLKKTAKDTRK